MPAAESPAGFFTRLRRKRDEVGWRYLLYTHIRRHVPPGILQFRQVFVTALRPGPEALPLPPGLSLREATEDDAASLVAFGDSRERLRERFARGDRLWVIERKGRFLACDCLINDDRNYADWLVVEGAEGDVWSGYIVVGKGHRGRRLGPILRSHVARECRKLGYRRMLGSIETLNRNSVKALARAGYEAVGSLFFIRVLGIALVHDGTRWRCGLWHKRRPLRLSVADLAEASPSAAWASIRRGRP